MDYTFSDRPDDFKTPDAYDDDPYGEAQILSTGKERRWFVYVKQNYQPLDIVTKQEFCQHIVEKAAKGCRYPEEARDVGLAVLRALRLPHFYSIPEIYRRQIEDLEERLTEAVIRRIPFFPDRPQSPSETTAWLQPQYPFTGQGRYHEGYHYAEGLRRREEGHPWHPGLQSGADYSPTPAHCKFPKGKKEYSLMRDENCAPNAFYISEENISEESIPDSAAQSYLNLSKMKELYPQELQTIPSDEYSQNDEQSKRNDQYDFLMGAFNKRLGLEEFGCVDIGWDFDKTENTEVELFSEPSPHLRRPPDVRAERAAAKLKAQKENDYETQKAFFLDYLKRKQENPELPSPE